MSHSMQALQRFGAGDEVMVQADFSLTHTKNQMPFRGVIEALEVDDCRLRIKCGRAVSWSHDCGRWKDADGAIVEIDLENCSTSAPKGIFTLVWLRPEGGNIRAEFFKKGSTLFDWSKV